MAGPRRHWREMTTRDFSDADTSDWIAVLPIAAIEQHGPHLPVGVDALIADAMVERCAAALPEGSPATFLPVQEVCKSNEHIAFPGTLTLDWDTAIRSWLQIGESVVRAGLRKMIIVTSHGGNVAPMEIVARELRQKHCDGCGHDVLDAPDENAGLRLSRGADGRHPWRAVGDVDDAGALPRACPRGPGGGFRQRADGASSGLGEAGVSHGGCQSRPGCRRTSTRRARWGTPPRPARSWALRISPGRWRGSWPWSRTWRGIARRSRPDAIPPSGAEKPGMHSQSEGRVSTKTGAPDFTFAIYPQGHVFCE
jgi:hypothetical protein